MSRNPPTCEIDVADIIRVHLGTARESHALEVFARSVMRRGHVVSAETWAASVACLRIQLWPAPLTKAAVDAPPLQRHRLAGRGDVAHHSSTGGVREKDPGAAFRRQRRRFKAQRVRRQVVTVLA